MDTAAQATTTPTTTWEAILADVSAIIGAIAPVVDLASPTIGTALTVVGKLSASAAAAEPTAVALMAQIKSGTPATPDQLATAISAYEAAYAQLDADIAAKLAQTAPPVTS